MNKELILTQLTELGFSMEEIPELGHVFNYEGITYIYMPDEDESFLRFAVPNIFDVTDDNRGVVLEVVNDTNMGIKYSKVCVYSESVWAFYEYRLFANENIEEIIEHCLLLLQATIYLFRRKVEGEDDVLLGSDNDKNEMKEDKK